MNKIVAVVVTYNRLQKLQKCIGRLLVSQEACDVIVVNNASTDGTAEWLESVSGEGVTVLNSETNIGGAGGFNIGVKEAVGRGYDFVWLMDDDCMVLPETLTKLMEADAILGGGYGWLSSVALWTDGSPCAMNRQKVSSDFYSDAHLLRHTLLRATQATFVSLFVRSSVVSRFGLPIKEFFIWGDDVEFTRRIAVRGGMRSFVVGDSVVCHEMNDNNASNISADGVNRIARYRYAYRNEAYLYRQEGVKGVCYFFAKCVLNTWRILLRAKGHRLRRLRTLAQGALQGLFFSPKVETLP